MRVYLDMYCLKLDYARERDQFLPEWDAQTLTQRLRETTGKQDQP